MRETAEKVAEHFQENLLAAAFICFVAGYFAVQSVMPGRKSGFIFYGVVGVVGAFLGQAAIVYLGLERYLGGVSSFRPLFDLLAAYVGAFVFASLMHFFKPL